MGPTFILIPHLFSFPLLSFHNTFWRMLYFAKHFLFMRSHHKCMRRVLLLFPFYKCINQGMETWNSLPKTQSPNLWLNQNSHPSLWLLMASLSHIHKDEHEMSMSVRVWFNCILNCWLFQRPREVQGRAKKGERGPERKVNIVLQSTMTGIFVFIKSNWNQK